MAIDRVDQFSSDFNIMMGQFYHLWQLDCNIVGFIVVCDIVDKIYSECDPGSAPLEVS